MLNAKYTDQDVRESQDLHDAALAYLRRYQGDFPFLVKAKNYLTDNDDLPVATIRGVLNCMRADPLAAMLLPQTPTGRYEDDGFWRPEPVRPYRVQRTRPATVRLKSIWHVEYALSTWATAEVYHVLKLEHCYMVWYPHQGQFGYHIEPWCGYPLGYSFGSRYILTNDRQNRRMCKGCQRKLAERQVA